MWTGAGLGTCLDLSLTLAADDHGQDVALRVARQPVIYPVGSTISGPMVGVSIYAVAVGFWMLGTEM